VQKLHVGLGVKSRAAQAGGQERELAGIELQFGIAVADIQASMQYPHDLQAVARQVKTSMALDLAGVDAEERVVHQHADLERGILRIDAGDLSWLEVVEIDARERFLDVQFARLAVKADAVPVVNAIRGVGILLDLEDHIAAADGMDASAGQEQRGVLFGFDAMKAFRHGAVRDAALEFRAGDAALEAHENFRAGRGLGHIPHLRLGLAAEFRRDVRRRMDLKGKLVLRIDDLHEQRKLFSVRFLRAEQFRRVMFHQPLQVLARERAVGDDADIAGAIGNFPGLADGRVGRQFFLVKAFQIAPAPDALFEDGVKCEWIERCGHILKSSKLQHPSSREIPSTKLQGAQSRDLEFGIRNFP
jgi:hypothetical protein